MGMLTKSDSLSYMKTEIFYSLCINLWTVTLRSPLLEWMLWWQSSFLGCVVVNPFSKARHYWQNQQCFFVALVNFFILYYSPSITTSYKLMERKHQKYTFQCLFYYNDLFASVDFSYSKSLFSHAVRQKSPL